MSCPVCNRSGWDHKCSPRAIGRYEAKLKREQQEAEQEPERTFSMKLEEYEAMTQDD